jgi:quercetin dioxygenase-like cupin family protein
MWQRSCIIAAILSLFPVLFPVLAGENAYEAGVKTTRLLKTATTTIGQPIQYPETDSAEVTALRVEIPPGKETGWHKHPAPGYGYILSGKLTLEVEGGGSFQFEAGQAFVEVVNTLHNGKNLGTEPVEILVFFSGEKGKPFTVMEKVKGSIH